MKDLLLRKCQFRRYHTSSFQFACDEDRHFQPLESIPDGVRFFQTSEGLFDKRVRVCKDAEVCRPVTGSDGSPVQRVGVMSVPAISRARDATRVALPD